ncbi:D-alanyl-D-alanine carboxypeptidase family protein [Treponema sp.]|uniref:D-alanyl-D-alanine carboxypeptidase family protein n=1 Tax=Treponema sp. TaxID=166 RepID=UPI003F0A1E1E
METYTADFFKDRGPDKKTCGKFSGKKIRLAVFSILALLVIFISGQAVSVYAILHPREPEPLTEEQKIFLADVLDKKFPARNETVSRLPFQFSPADLPVNAQSAIVIDFATGNILFEKNADAEIPPASMTKLVEMYVVFEAVENREASLDDVVPLPPESWARNLPQDASVMFLDEGQRVTLRELLTGLAVASGNDASVAVANYICGSMDSFVARMNHAVKKMGLEKTEFVDSSGYSEKNVTTAREFSAFCRNYISRFPDSLREFHSKKILRYPLGKNLPAASAQKNGDGLAVVQYNTNKLLGNLEGCDGLKTGFINESGYNIALTAERNGVRYISVTMRGPGNGTAQGNFYRVKDGTCLMEFAFSKFSPYIAEQEHSFCVGTSGSSVKSIRLVPAASENFSVPFIAGNSPQEAAAQVQVEARMMPRAIFGEIDAGTQFGVLTYSVNGVVLNSVPLVADRNSGRVNFLIRIWDSIAFKIAALL